MIVVNSYPISATLSAAKPAHYDEACKEVFKSIPGLIWDKSQRHYFGDPVAISAALELCESAKIAIVKRSSLDYAEYIAQHVNPKPPLVFDFRLLEFQKQGIAALNQILFDYGAALLADEMGLGKTPQAICLLDYNFVFEPRIIVAPAMVVPNWRREIAKWSGNPSAYWVGSYEDFQAALKLTAPKKRSGKPLLYPLLIDAGAIVFDEAHYLANASTKRAEAIKTYCKSRPKMKRLALTGTPFKTYVRSLHCLLDILFPGEFGTFFQFTRRYCNGFFDKINTAGGEERRVWDSSGTSNLEELNARLALRSIRRTKKEVLHELPAKRRSVIDVPLPAKVRKSLRDMAKASAMAIELGATSSIHRLLSTVEEHKIEAAISLATECIEQGHKPLILSLRRETAEKIASSLNIVCAHGGTTPDKREDTLKAQSAATSTIDACQVGMNLTNFDVTIFVGFDWDPTKLLQAEDRIHRIGQHDSCMIYYLCGESSIDEIVRSKVIDRLDIFANVIGKEDSLLTFDLNAISEEEMLKTWAARIEKGI